MKFTTNPDHILRWLFSCLIFLLAACNNEHKEYNRLIITAADSAAIQQKADRAFASIDSIKKIIKSGDLITRTGADFTSESLRSLNRRDHTYSHCGIASVENDSVFVYHALGGEWNPDQRIRRDPIELFGEPYSNRGIGVFRFQLLQTDIEQLMVTVKKLYRMGIMFDMKFDLATNDHMYCAEFVYKSYLMGTKGKLQFNISHIGNFSFIGVDDLFLQPLCSKQIALVYK